MKILYLTPGCFDKGGISRYCRYQISAIRETIGDSQCYFASLMGPDSESFEADFEVDYHGRSNSKWQQLLFTIKVMLIAIFERPKVIHVAHINFSGLAIFLARLSGGKAVLNVYGLEVWSKLSWDASYGLRHVDFIISDCHNTKNYIVREKNRQEKDISVIWDCVDLKRFNKYDDDYSELLSTYGLPSKEGSRIILTLGRIAHAARHKGYHRLLDVFSKLSNPEYKLIIAGKGDLIDELKSISIKKGIQDRVFFTGAVHDNHMAQLYSYADIFSLVSETGEKMGEGIPLTPLEAMACGTPIIVGNMDGSQEAVHSGKNGIVVPSKDLNAHLNAIQEVYNNLQAYSDESRKIAERHFSYEGFREKHHKFYQNLNLSGK